MVDTKWRVILHFLRVVAIDIFIGSAIVLALNALLFVLFKVQIAPLWLIVGAATVVELGRFAYNVISKRWIFVDVKGLCVVIDTSDLEE